MFRETLAPGWLGAWAAWALLTALLSACGNTSASSAGGSGGVAAVGGGDVGAGGGLPAGGGPANGGASGGAASGGITFVKAPNTEAGDLFGASVALSADGTILVVGAPGEDSAPTAGMDDNTAADSGAAYVYLRTGDSWTPQAFLKGSRVRPGDLFGSALAISADGSTLAIGAPYDSSASHGVDGAETSEQASASGAVYVFARSGSSWTEHAYLKPHSGDQDDLFGVSLALTADGSRLAIGAEAEDGAASGIDGDEGEKGGAETGAAFLFERAAGAWAQTHYFKARHPGSSDKFGGSVALSGDGGLLAVGARREDSAAIGVGGEQDDDTDSSSGAVYLFSFEGAVWQESAYLKPSSTDTNASDNFGCSVALSADATALAVGAVGDPSSSLGVNGVQEGASMPYAGAAYLFELIAGSWQQEAYLKASNTGAGDEFGHHLALSGDGSTLTVGAAIEASGSAGPPSDDASPGAGAVYVFARSGVTVSQTAFLKAPRADIADRFGWAVGLSAAGDTLAIGATRESSAATGIDGDQDDNTAMGAGAVYIHELSAD